MNTAIILVCAIIGGLKAEYEPIDVSGLGTMLYNTPKTATGDLVKKWTKDSNVNPEELGQDMYLTPPKAANGLVMPLYSAYKWPNAKVPYTINGAFTAAQKALIQQAIGVYNTKTCIRFIPRTTEANYVTFKSADTGCWSNIGNNRVAGQPINLQIPGCVTLVGTIIHEMMHTLGFFHEHTRPDRDTYVTINNANIIQDNGIPSNFVKESTSRATTYNIAYDYGSVMHYSATSFTVNGKPTIVNKQPLNGKVMGQRANFSANDIMAINVMYCGVAAPSG